MPHPQFDRSRLRIKPLKSRKNKVFIERDHIPVTARPRPLGETGERILDETVEHIRQARENDKPRMMSFGAHSIKNGLAPVFIRLIESGWITHLATNGAGIIHDWEFAFQGCSSEEVKENTARGEFGIWQETGFYINLAIVAGAYENLGYGESVGALVENEALEIPEPGALRAIIRELLDKDPSKASAACDLANAIRTFDIEPGTMAVAHPYKRFGLQAAAYRLGVPFTGHPMIGHDIIYTHPMNNCAAIGRTAERDFLTFAEGVSRLNGGVYLSVGSAVMSPMIFEKSLSMSQNVALQNNEHIDKHFMVIVDLQESHWDWQQGEPPESNPDYYLRYNKSFSRMGGAMRYVSADNRDFLLTLLQRLENIAPDDEWQPRGGAK